MIVKEISHNRILMAGIVFLITAFLLALLSVYPEYRTLSILAAALAIFGAALALRGYISFIGELKRERWMKGQFSPLISTPNHITLFEL